MGYNLMLQNNFKKESQIFWEKFMETLFQYKTQILQTNSYVFNLYLIYVRLVVFKDNDFIYTQ